MGAQDGGWTRKKAPVIERCNPGPSFALAALRWPPIENTVTSPSFRHVSPFFFGCLFCLFLPAFLDPFFSPCCHAIDRSHAWL